MTPALSPKGLTNKHMAKPKDNDVVLGAAEIAKADAKQTAEHEAASAKALADLAAAKEKAAADAKAEAEKQAENLKDAPRMKRWEALVANFKKERPEAYEARKHTGEFDKPPADFL